MPAVAVSCIPALRGVVRVGIRSSTPWRRLCSSKNAPVEYADKSSNVKSSSSTTSLLDDGKLSGPVRRVEREGSRRSSSSLMQRTQAFIVGAGISLGVSHFLLNEVRCLGLIMLGMLVFAVRRTQA